MEIPKHLAPFLDGTPLALERLKLAWSHLPGVDRIYLLSTLLADSSIEPKSVRLWHFRKQLIDLALADQNAYIRYLGAKEIEPPVKIQDGPKPPEFLEDQARFEKVRADPLLLVRSACQEKWGKPTPSELDDPSSFWSRTQLERLALVNGLQEGGEKIAKLLRYANKELLPIQAIRVEEMMEVALQFLTWKPIVERFADSEDSAFRYNDRNTSVIARASIKALWEVIPDVPKELSYLLIDCLPLTDKLNSMLSPPIQEILDDQQLELLLFRNDLSIGDLRRTVYEEFTNYKIRQAALSSPHFKLQDSDISALVYDPREQVDSGKKKVQELALLAFWCKSATGVQMKAIRDLILEAPPNFRSGVGEWDERDLDDALQNKCVKVHSLGKFQDQFQSLFLYPVAKRLASITSDQYFSEDTRERPATLNRHRRLVVPHNTWQTYLNLKEGICPNRLLEVFGQWMKSLSNAERILFALAIVFGIFLLYR